MEDPIVVSFPKEGNPIIYHLPDGEIEKSGWIIHRLRDNDLHSYVFQSKEEAEGSDVWNQ